MLNTLAIFEDLSRHIDRQVARKISEIVGQIYEEVAQTVTKKPFNELKEIIGDLAQAQMKTERSLNRLIEDHRQTRERLENMSDAVGYPLENPSYKGLPPLLKKDLGIEVEGRLIRRYLPGEKEGQCLQAVLFAMLFDMEANKELKG
jgi:rubrerythrin